MSASVSFSEATEGEVQDMTPVLVNGSPKLPRLPMPSAMDHESFDITLHRKDTEGFGFVILTSKSKPPYGGGSFKILRSLHSGSILSNRGTSGQLYAVGRALTPKAGCDKHCPIPIGLTQELQRH